MDKTKIKGKLIISGEGVKPLDFPDRKLIIGNDEWAVFNENEPDSEEKEVFLRDQLVSDIDAAKNKLNDFTTLQEKINFLKREITLHNSINYELGIDPKEYKKVCPPIYFYIKWCKAEIKRLKLENPKPNSQPKQTPKPTTTKPPIASIECYFLGTEAEIKKNLKLLDSAIESVGAKDKKRGWQTNLAAAWLALEKLNVVKNVNDPLTANHESFYRSLHTYLEFAEPKRYYDKGRCFLDKLKEPNESKISAWIETFTGLQSLRTTQK